VAEVNDAGKVTVEGEFVGKLDGFQFSQDKGAGAAEAKTIKTAALQALAPHFHLRADRFYNAPDTEIDYTEQGGLMWGSSAVGKLVQGPDPLKPQVEVFVDDVAGSEVAQKVQRRLQHFIERKVVSLFEPLIALQHDDALNGLAKGFAFRVVESMGVLRRANVADEVKALDQDSRAVLRKHGIRFGQFTIFMPILLKPAATRLRLVLWSLSKCLNEFPESPPPGLVTIPAMPTTPQGADTIAGYHNAGERAIRIDMLERLADMLRSEDSRGGFEAKADMLSITGMTLIQFSELMTGLGYRVEKGERQKVKAQVVMLTQDLVTDQQGTPIEGSTENAVAAKPVINTSDEREIEKNVAERPKELLEDEPIKEKLVDSSVEVKSQMVEAPEMEVFYTFSWARPSGGQRSRPKPQGTGTPRGKGKPNGKSRRKPSDSKSQNFSARPPRAEKKIDPDNPFAVALMGLRDNK